MSHDVSTVEELRALYGFPQGLALRKCIPRLDPHARAFIARSPFICLSTADASGRADISPRGDPAGFVRVLDDETLAIPDRPGNNRIDSMANIIANPNVATIFLIPGLEETLRVNGKAAISRDPDLIAGSVVHGKAPKVMIVVKVEEVFFHCAKALKRSRLWEPEAWEDPGWMPPLARIVMEQTTPREEVSDDEVNATEARIQEAYRTTLY